MNITVFLGAPGSGKGTQAKRLAESFGFDHLSTGDMLRSAIQSKSEIGLRAKNFIERGDLVPDSLMITVIEAALTKLQPTAKVILDGFPRTVPQAEALDSNKLTAVKAAICFDVPESVLVERLTGRRICEQCGQPFHMVFLPPKVAGKCDRCGGMLIQRSDDSENVVRRRLEIFEEQNGKLVEYYNHKGKLRQLDGNSQINDLQDAIIKIIQ